MEDKVVVVVEGGFGVRCEIKQQIVVSLRDGDGRDALLKTNIAWPFC